MKFIYLEEPLWKTAETVANYLRAEQGASGFQAEQQVHKAIDYVPTLRGTTTEAELICVEVTQIPHRQSFDGFVADCKSHGLAVKVYMAMPVGVAPDVFKQNFQFAKKNGVGIIEVDADKDHCVPQCPALSLSLGDVRPVTRKLYPPAYRARLEEAEATFRNGSPAKGCSVLYDEIEALTRRIAQDTHSKGLWRPPKTKPGKPPPKLDFDKGNWNPLMKQLLELLKFQQLQKTAPGLKDSLVHRVLAITPFRNLTGHKPKTQEERKERDRQLRTRFEEAADLLLELIKASKPLGI
jgi:hypothetical protein